MTDKGATATEAGSKHEKCTVCGYAKAAVEIPATGMTTDTSTGGIQTGDTTATETGDNSSMLGWLALMLGSVLGILCMMAWRKWDAD